MEVAWVSGRAERWEVPLTKPSEGLPHPSPAVTTHLLALDGARGLAVLLVLLDHAADADMQPFGNLNRLGKYGVYLFFVLSAFLLTHQFQAWRQSDFLQPWRWGNYFLRRAARVY